MANDSSLKFDITMTGYRDENGKYNLLSYDVNIPKDIEDLKSISCSTCKYGHTYSDVYIECSNSKTDTEGLCFEKDFYCKNWEQDENL